MRGVSSDENDIGGDALFLWLIKPEFYVQIDYIHPIFDCQTP